MYVLKSKWGVEIEAEPRDLENIVHKINNSIASKSDLFISKANSVNILRTNKWDTARTIDEVTELAKSNVDLIRGTIDLLEACGPVEIGTVFEFDSDSRIVRQQRNTIIRVRVYPTKDGMVSPAEFQQCLNVSMANDKSRMAFSAFSSDPNWYDIYKCIEALKRHYGDENKMLNSLPKFRSKISLIKRTSNSYRHTEGAFEPIANPANLEESIDILKEVLKETLHSTMYKAHCSAIDLRIPNLTTIDGEGIGLKRLSLGPAD